MNISFSTINEGTAKQYLESPKYDYFNSKTKKLILECIGKNILRVQDPFMYPEPALEITDEGTYYKIKKIMRGEKKK